MRTSLRRRGGLAAAAALTAAATVAALAVTSAPAPADTGAACGVAYAIAWQTPSDTGAACGVAYAIAWQTPSDTPPDFGATVTVTNNSSYPISGWTVTCTYTAGQSIVAGSAYSANVTQTGSMVTATPEAGYNANLAAGSSTTWGFHADYNGTSNPVPAITCAGPSQGSGSATLSGSLDPLGVNTAAWDSNFTDPAIASDLSAAGVGLIRYPGGSWADQYLWQPNNVAAVNASYDGTISPGGNVSLGFQGTWTSNDTSPANFSLNGTACT